MNNCQSFLAATQMTGGYGGADILHDCSITVEKGEIAVIVGPNGAGKSTAMKAVFGMLALREGSVVLDGEDITGLTPQARVGMGMGFVPQTNNVFVSMSVEENLEMGAFTRDDDFKGTMEQVFDLFPILKEKRRQPAGELSGGQRQQVAVGRALMTQPKLARQALNIADHGFVLVQGRNRFTDTGEALLANPDVRRSFLGG